MSLFRKSVHTAGNPCYPISEYKPVIRQSICTGEKTGCMQNRQTGKLTELMLIRNDEDLSRFLREYGLKKSDIEIIY